MLQIQIPSEETEMVTVWKLKHEGCSKVNVQLHFQLLSSIGCEELTICFLRCIGCSFPGYQINATLRYVPFIR